MIIVERIKVISVEHAERLCKENNLKLIKLYKGRGQFNKDKLMVSVEILDKSDEKHSYVFQRSDGLYLTGFTNSYYRSHAKVYELTVSEAIKKLNFLNEYDGPIRSLKCV